MNVFDLRDRLVGDYASYTRSFIKIADPRISDTVETALDAGVPFEPSQVIGETLERATPEVDATAPEVRRALREAVMTGGVPPSSYEPFRQHPLSSWIESTFGVRSEEGSGRLVRQVPRRLHGEGSVAEELARITETDADACRTEPKAIDQQLGILVSALPDPQTALEPVAATQAAAQLAAHERVREAARAKGRVTISPVLPVDVLGAYVLLPPISGVSAL